MRTSNCIRQEGLTLPIGFLCLWTLLSLVLGAGPAAATTPYDDVLVQQAVENLKQENYEEAVAGLTEAWNKGAHTPEKALLLGQAYRALLNYPKALEFLQEAVRLKPDFPAAQFLLADTLVALNRSAEARPMLQNLEAAGFEPGQTAFLLGVIASKEGRYDQALGYFRRAEQEPKVAQEAKFQASMALANLRRYNEAGKSLQESITLAPQSPTADFAKRYLGVLSATQEKLRPFHAWVSTGYDYDSNVSINTLQPNQVVTSGKPSSVYTQTAGAEYNFFPTGPFSILTQYSYFQNFHPNVTGFDVMNHYVGVIPTYGFANGRLWVPFNFNYMDLASDKYYTDYLIAPTYLHLLNEHVGLEAGARYNREYYWTPLFLPQDDRSGKSYGGSLGMYYFFKKQTGFVQGRFSYTHYATIGNNWDNSAYRLLLAALYPMLDNRLKFNIFLDLTLQPYDHFFFNGVTAGNILGAPLIPNPKRLDQILIFGVQATYEIYKGLEFNVHYYYIRDDSNIPAYDYNRNLVGFQLGYRY